MRTPIAYAYGRVSTDQQEYGLEAQTKSVTDYYANVLKAKGYDFGGMYADADVSGSVAMMSRPRSLEMCRKLEKGDMVVVAKMDRAFRSLYDFAYMMDLWRKNGVTLVALDVGVDTSTEIGELVGGIMVCIAQWERRRISSRIREGIAAKKARGLIQGPGQAPMGIKVDKLHRMHHDYNWHEEAAYIVELRDDCCMSWENIAWAVTERRCQKRGLRFKRSAFHPLRLDKKICHRYYHEMKRLMQIEEENELAQESPGQLTGLPASLCSDELVNQPS